MLLGPIKEGKKVHKHIVCIATAPSIGLAVSVHSAYMFLLCCNRHLDQPIFDLFQCVWLPISQIMCSPFWPTEAIHSAEYGQLVVTFVDTTPECDWKMTILQVADKNRVSSPLVFQSSLFVTF